MDIEKEVVEGFNAGYLIEKYKPALAKELVKSLEGVDLPFAEGFVAGSREFVKERGKSKFLGKLRGTKSIPSIPKKDKEKGFDIER